MADKAAQQKEVETPAEEVEKPETEETTPVESKNGDSTENGEPTEKENGKEEEEKTPADSDDTDKVCSVKRKSTGGGDATSEAAAEGATPEKKAKLAETTEAESNGEAEVAA